MSDQGDPEHPVTDQHGRRKLFRKGQHGEVRWLVHTRGDDFAYSNGRDPLEPWRVIDAASESDWVEITDEDELQEIEASLA